MVFDSRGKQRKSQNVKPHGSTLFAVGDLSRWLGADNLDHLHDVLREGGVEWGGPASGRMVAEGVVADVHLEPDEFIRVRCDVDLSDSPRRLLERGAGAAGCVRCGMGPTGLQLAAETRINGAAHLPESLAEIRSGFSLLIQQSNSPAVQQKREQESSTQAVRAAIEQTGLIKEDVVETADGYELQTQIEGSRVPVQVVLQSGAALVQRTVLQDLPEGVAGIAVAHQALVWNARLRCCRLAVSGGRMRVEGRLRAKLINGDWLQLTMRAVASAARSLEPELELLAGEAIVAQAYVNMFGLATAYESLSS